MNSFKNRRILQSLCIKQCLTYGANKRETHASNVPRRSETQTTNQTGTHVGKNVTIQIGHYHNSIRVRSRVLHYLSAVSFKKKEYNVDLECQT